MPNPPINLQSSHREDAVKGQRLAKVSLMVAAVALLFILIALYFWRSNAAAPAGTADSQNAPGPEERAYAAKVGVDKLEVSRAENFLHQEVTTVSGQITNGGERALASVELTIEFSDEQNQIAQREVRSLFGPPGPPIPPGDNREFEVSFDHISAMWNMRQPVVKVTGLQFSNLK